MTNPRGHHTAPASANGPLLSAPIAAAGSAPHIESACVSRLARDWLRDIPILVERYLAQVHRIGDYRDRSVPEESLREYAAASMELLLHLIAGEPVPDQLVHISAMIGRDRARRKIPLEALVRALQLNFRIVWDALLARAESRDADTLLDCGPLIWEAVGTHLTRAVSGYQETVAEMARERQDSRRAAFAALVDSGGKDTRVVKAAAAALALDETARFAVVVAAAGAERALRVTAAEVRKRSEIYHQESPTGDVLIIQLPAKLADLPGSWLGDISCAVGPIAQGLEQLPAALHLAIAMLRLPRQGADGPLRLRDAWLGLLGLHAAAIMPLLIADVLGPFTSTRDQEATRILDTVRAYLEDDCSLAKTAARLYCHRNTVVNRLRHFAELTGRDVRQPSDAAVVLIALMALRQQSVSSQLGAARVKGAPELGS